MAKNEAASIAGIVDNLIEAAAVIVKHKTQLALGKDPEDESYKYNGTEQAWVMNYVEPMIKQAQQIRAIEAQNSTEIIKMLTKGKLTIEEAIQLMSLMKIQVDVKEKELRVEIQESMMKLLQGGKK
jgi:uncharacterized FlgJ-related protein